MGLWDRFKTKSPEDEKLIDPTSLAARINPLLDQLNHRVFLEHQASLLNRPIDFVVPAVWGARKDGPLSPEQMEIHQKVLPVIQEVFRILDLQGLSEPQRFAVDFLLRGLIINRLTYTIETARNRGLRTTPGAACLENLEPVGTA